jgi:excisionase family DNA binding protein
MAIKQKDQTHLSVPEAHFVTHGALNIAESAIYCGVRCSAIESVIRDGKLPGRRLGRNVIILKSDLDAFLASLDIIPAHTPPSILARRAARAVNATPAPARKTQITR